MSNTDLERSGRTDMSAISIEYLPLMDADAPRLSALYNEYLTEGESLIEATHSAWRRGDCFGTKAVCGGEMIGFFSARRGMVLTYPHPELEAELHAVAGDTPTWVVDGMLVLPGYQGRGIARELVARTVSTLRQRTKLLLIEIWIYPDGRSPGKGPQETAGEIVFQKKVPMFYRDMAHYGLRCPICGENCRCGAWIDLVKI